VNEVGSIPGRDYGKHREYFSKKIPVTLTQPGFGEPVLPETLVYTTRRPHSVVDVFAFSPVPSHYETVIKLYAVNGDVRTLLDSGRIGFSFGAAGTFGIGIPVNNVSSFLASNWILSTSACCERYDITISIYGVRFFAFVAGEGAPKVEWSVSVLAHSRNAGGQNNSRGIRLWTPNQIAAAPAIVSPNRTDVAVERPLLVHFYGTNNGPVARYVQLVNVVPGGVVAGLPAIFQTLVPAGSNFSYAPPQHWRDEQFSEGMTWVVSTTKDVVTLDPDGDFSNFVAYK